MVRCKTFLNYSSVLVCVCVRCACACICCIVHHFWNYTPWCTIPCKLVISVPICQTSCPLKTTNFETVIIDPEMREIMCLVSSIHLSVTTLPAEPFDLQPSSFALRSTLPIARLVRLTGKSYVFPVTRPTLQKGARP